MRKSYNETNCLLSTITIFSVVVSFGLFLTFILLLSTNPQFIALGHFTSTGKYPAILFYVAIVLTVIYAGLFVASMFGVWATSQQSTFVLKIFISSMFVAGFIQLASGILSLVYMQTMPGPLRIYMADNLRSNYTGGLGINFLERQFDLYVDWVQTNYQCCGVNSFEDYRNGFYYNTYNKYTIVNIVPNSCCVYRDQLNQLTQCQMKSVNIFRKGCYDVLIWWLQQFGSLICGLTLSVGVLDVVGAFGACVLIKRLDEVSVREKQRAIERLELSRNKIHMHHITDLYDTNTLEETMSNIDTRS